MNYPLVTVNATMHWRLRSASQRIWDAFACSNLTALLRQEFDEGSAGLIF